MEGPPQSPRELFARHGPAVYRRARQLLGTHHEAEEALQEVFLRVLTRVDTFEHRSSITTWLYQITTNFCLNRLRDGRRRDELLREHGEGNAAGGQPPADPEGLALVRQLLGRVGEAEATAAVHVYLDGMTHEEAAELMGVSRRTVGNLLERFRAQAGGAEVALPETSHRRVEEP